MFEISFFAVLGLLAGAVATFALATMLPDDVQRSGERNGRYAYLGGCDDWPPAGDGRPARAALQRIVDAGRRGGRMRVAARSCGADSLLSVGRWHRATPLRAQRMLAMAASRIPNRRSVVATSR